MNKNTPLKMYTLFFVVSVFAIVVGILYLNAKQTPIGIKDDFNYKFECQKLSAITNNPTWSYTSCLKELKPTEETVILNYV